MSELSKTIKDKLPELKKHVEEAYEYWQDNNKRFNESKNFVFASALSQSDISKLNALQKPALEFNSTEAFISRQRGEFSAHQPSINVGLADGVLPSRITPTTTKVIEVVRGHVADIMYETSRKGLQDNFYNDSMGGGFAVGKIGTKYIDDMSFEQCIYFDRVFDPTLTGFDPLAREPHKGDGRYCFEIIPKTKEEFDDEYGENLTKGMKFSNNLGGFKWSYGGKKTRLVMIAQIWVKKRKKVKIAKLSNGHTILSKHYKGLQELWDLEQRIEQMPIILEERMSIMETIDMYEICESAVLRHAPSDYGLLPLIFCDGNSTVVKKSEAGMATQMTRNYAYQVRGIQKLKNLAGQTIASEIEGMVENKWIAAVESIPEDYLGAYKNPQKAQSLLYKAFYKGDPEHPLPPPREVVRTPMPEIVQQTFIGADQVMQGILGSYDAQMGITDGDTSGKAIIQGSMHSSAAAKPFSTNYIIFLNQAAKIILDLMPKYYVTPRSIPIRKANGTKGFQIINDDKDPNSLQIKYKTKDLQIKIEAGVNMKLEKQMYLEQTTKLMAASEQFARFMNEECMPDLVKNLDVQGGEDMLLKAEAFMKRMKEERAAMAGQPSAEDKMIQAQVDIENNKTQQRRDEAEGKLSVQVAQLALDKEKADMEFFRLMAEVEELEAGTLHAGYRMDSDITASAIDAAIATSQHQLEINQHLHDQEMDRAQSNQAE